MVKGTDFSASGMDEFAGDEPISLGDAAAAALHGDGEQGVFDETQATKVKFTGMGFDSFEGAPKIGDEMTFQVRARCIGVGAELMKTTGTTRHTVRMDVLSVVPIEA